MNLIANHIYTKKLNLDLVQLKKSTDAMYEFIKNNYSYDSNEHNAQLTLTTRLFKSYNLLLFTYPQFHELFHAIRNTFLELNDLPDKQFYIASWLNYYRQGDDIGWHEHSSWNWHGFVCVDCETSKTTYKIDGNLVDVNSENNLLVISKSNGTPHRTWPWPYADRPRITIAFDITTRESINLNTWSNHWIPL
jgi:hypothetical protein